MASAGSAPTGASESEPHAAHSSLRTAGELMYSHWMIKLSTVLSKLLPWTNVRHIARIEMLSKAVPTRIPLIPGLAPPSPTSHDFYLVCVPHGDASLLLTGSRAHWSVYCAGHFYHLSAPRKAGGENPLQQSQVITEHSLNRSPRLKHEDLSASDTEDYGRLQRTAAKKVLVAYQVGQTDLPPSQLLCKAQALIDVEHTEYRTLAWNCQDFVMSMFEDVVVRWPDRSVFVGSATQIADWDTRVKGKIDHINNVSNGYCVCAPAPYPAKFHRWGVKCPVPPWLSPPWDYWKSTIGLHDLIYEVTKMYVDQPRNLRLVNLARRGIRNVATLTLPFPGPWSLPTVVYAQPQAHSIKRKRRGSEREDVELQSTAPRRIQENAEL